jgi:group I intron endonuclease
MLILSSKTTLGAIPPDSGIYLIRNTKNGKSYIGSTSNFRKRIQSHFLCLKRGIHKNKALQFSFNKNGINAFQWAILEYVKDLKLLSERESFWIKEYSSLDKKHGYNICEPGFIPRGANHSAEKRKKQSEKMKRFYKENPDARLEISRRSREMWENPALRERMTASIRKNRCIVAPKVSVKLKALFSTPEWRKKLSENAANMYKDPILLQKLSKARKEAASRNTKHMSSLMKKKWENPEFRNKMLKIRKEQVTTESRKKMSKSFFRAREDKDFCAKVAEKRRLTVSTPAFKIKARIKALKYVYHLVSPLGEKYICFSLNDFSKEFNVSASAMFYLVCGKYSQIKGWTGTKEHIQQSVIDSLLDEFKNTGVFLNYRKM